MRFNFKDYFDTESFEFKVDVDISHYKFIRFASQEAQKAIFYFYRVEMQQCNSITTPNLGHSSIAQTGFFEACPKRPCWKKFKNNILPIVLYSFDIVDGVVRLSPINIYKNNEIYRTNPDEILEL